MSEFVQFFRPKIQGLFKDFLGSYLEISKSSSLESLYLTEQNVYCENYVLGTQLVQAQSKT